MQKAPPTSRPRMIVLENLVEIIFFSFFGVLADPDKLLSV
jgi:hypothetical protein